VLSDGQVRQLLIRAGRAHQADELFPILRELTTNRIALTHTIQQLTTELSAATKSAEPATKFDLALLDQLKLTREELETAHRERERVLAENGTLRGRTLKLEEDFEGVQRRAEKAARDLLRTTRERDGLTAQLSETDRTLNQTVADLTATRAKLEQTESQLSRLKNDTHQLLEERRRIRTQLSEAMLNEEALQARLDAGEQQAGQLRSSVKRLIGLRQEDRQTVAYLSTRLTGLQRRLEEARPAGAQVIAHTRCHDRRSIGGS
jgi:chromosome segregation ATPase